MGCEPSKSESNFSQSDCNACSNSGEKNSKLEQMNCKEIKWAYCD